MYQLQSSRSRYMASHLLGRNELPINDELLSNIVTKNKDLPEICKERYEDCFDHSEIYTVKLCMLCEERTGNRYRCRRQSRVHCTRLVGQKADNWYLRQAPGSEFAVCRFAWTQTVTMQSMFTSVMSMRMCLREGEWQKRFKVKPPVFT